MSSIAIRDLKAQLSAVMNHVRLGNSVTVTLHRKPIARIEPLAIDQGMPTIPGVIWRGGGRKLGLHDPAVLVGDGLAVADLLLAQRGERG